MAEQSPLHLLRPDRLRTGVKSLDLILEGGYLHPSVTMLLGPSGPEKQCIAAHFAKEGMDEGDTVIYITTDRSPEEVEKGASEWDLNFKGPGKIYYIDCYSQSAKKEGATIKENVSLVDGPGALNEISLMMGERLREQEGKRVRLVMHSLSTFALYNEKNSLFKFIQTVNGRFKSANSTILMLVEDGMHDENFLMTLRHSIDEEFQIKAREGEKVLVGSRVPIPLPFKVGPLGIEVE